MKYTCLDMTHIAASHQAVITRAGGAAKLAHKIGVAPNTVKAWKRLNSIPAPYWQAVATAELATLDELAEAAARKAA